jgi:hypothetical protein
LSRGDCGGRSGIGAGDGVQFWCVRVGGGQCYMEGIAWRCGW